MFWIILAAVTALMLFGLLAYINWLLDLHLFDLHYEPKEEPEGEEEIYEEGEEERHEKENEDLFITFIDLNDRTDHSDDSAWSISYIPVRRHDRKDRPED